MVEISDSRIVLENDQCPFGNAVRKAPALCRVTSSVFGGIAARNRDDSAAVVLEERIAVGDPGVALSSTSAIRRPTSPATRTCTRGLGTTAT